MVNTLRQLLGLKQPQPLQDGPAIEAQHRSTTPESEKPLCRRAVPLEASFDPKDRSACERFMQQYHVAPANDGTSVLVFSDCFAYETPDGKVVYDYSEKRCDEPDYAERLFRSIDVYEHLFRDRTAHQRIVRYLGPTSTGFRLERLGIGHVWTSPPDSDAMLALYQRWALQVLSGLQWVHERGVTLQKGAINLENMWLRSDYSVAIASFITAGCLELGIPADHWPNCYPSSPWGVQEHSPYPLSWRGTGIPRGDIVDWASWVFQLMTGGDDPVKDDDEALKTWLAELRKRERDAEKGRFDDWPVLPNGQLGPVLLKAWRGEYMFAYEALEDTRRLLEECGRSLSLFKIDETDGFDWPDLFEVGKTQHGGPLLKLKSGNPESEKLKG